MAQRKANTPQDVSDQFSYKGKTVIITTPGDNATIAIDGVNFDAMRMGNGMWSSPGVFNHYPTLDELARHIVDYLHQFTPAQ